MRGKDLTGKIFERLTVISYSHSLSKSRNKHYLCKCVCGKEKIIDGRSLTRKLTTSCGCFNKEQVSKSGKLRRTDGVLMSAKKMWYNSYTDGCSLDLFLKISQQPCFYCDNPPSNYFNTYIDKKSGKIKKGISKEWADQSWFFYNGLDRVDSDLPHIDSNIVPCCKICNYAKRSMTLDQFRVWAKSLHQNLLKNKW